jgi:exodeoxyribonuclease X
MTHPVRIRIIDLETTGKTAEHSIIEIGAVDLVGNEIIPVGAEMVRPPCSIPPEASAVHHIVDEHVTLCAPIETYLSYFMDFDGAAGVSAFCAHKWCFEAQWLGSHLQGRPAICTLKAAQRMWPEAPAHNLQALRYWLKPSGIDPRLASAPHRAPPDAYVTAFILRELIKHSSISDLIQWTNEPVLLMRVNFGMHFGKAWDDVPDDYLRWLLGKGDSFDEDRRYTAATYLERRSAIRAAAKASRA